MSQSTSTDKLDFSMSTLSLNSTDSQNEDWDRSLISSDSDASPEPATNPLATTTPRNSVLFPADDQVDATPGKSAGSLRRDSCGGNSKRSLSELLKLHAEKGTNCQFSAEEASRLEDVLGQWINASSSPYEGEDDFFARSQDDLSVPKKRSPAVESRPRGQSESASSRPPSSAGFVATS